MSGQMLSGNKDKVFDMDKTRMENGWISGTSLGNSVTVCVWVRVCLTVLIRDLDLLGGSKESEKDGESNEENSCSLRDILLL